MANAGTHARLGAQLLKSFKPNISDQTRIGPSSRDNVAQTDRSEMVQLRETYEALERLTDVALKLRKDLSMSTYALKMEAKSLINDQATELYHHANNRLMEMEKRHHSQMTMLRRSFRTQLSDCVARIAAEYKNYYDEILSGKTGRHDRKIVELTATCSEQKATIKQNETVIQMLQNQIQKLSSERVEPVESEPEIIEVEPQGMLSQEEADELYAKIENLQLKVRELQMELNDKESGGKNLQSSLREVKEQLELERAKSEKLRAELESEKRRAAEEGARSSADLHAQVQALKHQLEEQRLKLEQEADEQLKKKLAEAQSSAMKKLQEELARQREVEEKLRRERDTLASQDSSKIVKQLQEQAKLMQQTIAKLQQEIKRINSYWSQKLAIVERNLNAIREESLLREKLNKQAASLHRAAITYAADGPVLLSGDMKSPMKPGPSRAHYQPHNIPLALPLTLEGGGLIGIDAHPPSSIPPTTWRSPPPTPSQQQF